MFSINKPTDRTRTTKKWHTKNTHSHMHSRHTEREEERHRERASERWSRIRSFFFLHVRTHTYAMQQREKWGKNATNSTAVCILHNVNTQKRAHRQTPDPDTVRNAMGAKQRESKKENNNKQQIIASCSLYFPGSVSLILFLIPSKCDFSRCGHTHSCQRLCD